MADTCSYHQEWLHVSAERNNYYLEPYQCSKLV